MVHRWPLATCRKPSITSKSWPSLSILANRGLKRHLSLLSLETARVSYPEITVHLA